MIEFALQLASLALSMTAAPQVASSPTDVGVCAPLIAVIDPDGDGVTENADSPQARAAAEACRAAGDPRGAVSVAYALRSAGQRDAARAAIVAAGEMPEALRVRCMLDGDDKLIGAVAFCDKAIAARPNWALAYSTRAVVLRNVGRSEAALFSNEEAVRLAPTSASMVSQRGHTFKALGRNEQALADFASAARLAPSSAPVLNDLAGQQYAMGRPAEGNATIERSLALKPTAYAYTERGKARRDAKQFDGAYSDFAAASALDPKWAVPWHEKTLALEDQKNYAAAIEASEQASARDPKWAVPVVERGWARFKLGQRAAAEADYLRGMALAPNWASPLHKIGLLYLQDGDQAKGLDWLRRAIALDPLYGAAHNDLAWELYKSGDKQGALASYNKSLAANPEYQPSLFWRARTHTDLKNFTAAIADYSKLVEVNRGYGWAWANRATLRSASGDLAGAAADMDKAAPILRSLSAFWDLWSGVYLQYAMSGSPGEDTRLQTMLDRVTANFPEGSVAGAYHARGLATMYRDDAPTNAMADIRRAVALDPLRQQYKDTLRLAETFTAWLQECRTVPQIKTWDLSAITAAQKRCYPSQYDSILWIYSDDEDY